MKFSLLLIAKICKGSTKIPYIRVDQVSSAEIKDSMLNTQLYSFAFLKIKYELLTCNLLTHKPNPIFLRTGNKPTHVPVPIWYVTLKNSTAYKGP